MGDEDDRNYLNSLPELEREKILNERHAKREANLKKKELIQRYNQEKGKKKNDLEELRRERDRRREKRNRDNRDNNYVNNEEFSYDEGEIEDDDYEEEFRVHKKRKPKRGDSDSDYENHDYGKPKKKLKTKDSEGVMNDRVIEANSDLKVIQNICLKRNFLLKMSPHLYFKQTVTDCLVKTTYKIASDKIDYRIGKIIDVIEKDEHYDVETQSGVKKLNKYLMVKIGNEDKEFQFVYISNKGIEERELHNWLEELETYNLQKPTLREINNKHNEIKNMLNSKYKGKDIKQMVEKKRETKYKNLNDFEKQRYLEKKIIDAERLYFEKPTHEGKRLLENLKRELKEILKSVRKKRSRKATPDKYYYATKKNKSELYGFSQGKKIGGDKDNKSNIHARTIANPLNMWSMKETELENALEVQKKRFEVNEKDKKNEEVDPHKALYNRNLAIKNDFMDRFQRELRIDDVISNLEVDMNIE